MTFADMAQSGFGIVAAMTFTGMCLCALGCQDAKSGTTDPNPAGDSSPTLSRTRQRLRERQPVRIVCYGDSISEVGRSPRWHGGASAPANNWGQVLGKRLDARYPGSRFTVRHFGIGGQNAYEGLGRLDGLAPFEPDLVLVAFGTNDMHHHPLPPAATGRALRELVSEIRSRYGADVVVVGSAGDNPQASTFQHIEETIAATRAAAQATGAPFVDMHAAILAATDNGRRWADYHLGETNCHPNDTGHRVWAEAAMTVITASVEAAAAAEEAAR